MCDWLVANTVDDIQRQARNLTRPIPLRGVGQSAQDRETWTLAKALVTSPTLFGGAFPLEIRHQDAPDFVVTTNGRTIGLEVVEAIQGVAAHAYAAINRNPDILGAELVFDPDLFCRKAASESEATIVARLQNDESGAGWFGDEPEQEWARCVTGCLQSKVAKAEKGNCSGHDELQLLIYDDVNVPPIRWSRALQMLAAEQELFRRLWLSFSAVHILTSDRVHGFFGSLAEVD